MVKDNSSWIYLSLFVPLEFALSARTYSFVPGLGASVGNPLVNYVLYLRKFTFIY